MKKITVMMIFILLLITTYPSIVAVEDVEEKSISFGETVKETKKHYSCYIEIEGVWDSNLKIMYWRFPYTLGLDTCFVFWWNISFPYNDAVVSIYRKQGGEHLYERYDLEEVKIYFFVGFYDSTYYYLIIKGNALIVESK